MVGALVVWGCAPGTPPPAVTPQGTPGIFLAGYHPWWGGEAGMYPMDLLDQLFYFEVEAGGDGTLEEFHGWPGSWTGLLERADRGGAQVAVTVTMHEPESFEAVFSHPARSARLVQDVMGLLRESPGLRGIHLDLEVFQPVSLEARDGYTAFVAALAREMRAFDPGVGLSLFLLAFDDDDAYNERALAALADYVVVQGYDLHNLNDQRAGPLAAVRGWGRLNWETIADRYAALGVPAGKLVMAAPLYGYRWPTVSDEPGAATRGPGVAIPLTAPPEVVPDLPRAQAEAAAHGVRRDPESGSPFYAYQDADGEWFQGWFDDDASLREKLRFVRDRGLGGLALFPLVYGDEAVWAVIRDARRER